MYRMRMLFLPAAFLMFFFAIGNIILAQKKLPDVEVKQFNGRPTVFIDGKPDGLPGYSPGNTREFYDKYMPLFYKHKMGVYPIWIGPGIASNAFWFENTIFDKPKSKEMANSFTLEDQIEHIMKGDPEAYVIIRFYTRPPDTWKKLHPNEYFIDDAGKVQETPSLASDEFWNKAAELSAAIVSWFRVKWNFQD